MPDPVVITPGAPAPSPAPAAPPVPPPAKPPDANFEAMVKREQAHVAAQKKLAEERQALNSEREGLKADLAEAQRLKALRERAKKNPDEFQREFYGEDWFRTLSEYALEKRPPPSLEVSELRDELGKLREETAADKRARIEEARAQEETERKRAIESFNQGVIDKVTKAGDKYELIQAWGAQSDVSDVIRDHWHKQADLPEEERKLLSWEEGAQMVEDWLFEKAQKLAKTKRLTTPPASVHPALRSTPEGSSPGARSIADLNGTSAQREEAPKLESEEERIKRAFAAYDAAVAAKTHSSAGRR